jgi:hypothetical protein
VGRWSGENPLPEHLRIRGPRPPAQVPGRVSDRPGAGRAPACCLVRHVTDARDYQIAQSHRVREGTYFDPKKGEISLAEFFHEFMRLAGPEEAKSRTNYESSLRNHVEPVLGVDPRARPDTS